MAEETKRPPIAFHPPLFAAFPILSIYSANLAIISLADLWIPLLVAVLISLPIWAICALIARSWSRGAAAASLISGTLVLYSPAKTAFPLFEYLSLWVFLIAILAFLVAKFIKNPYWLNLIGTLMVGVALGGILWGDFRADLDLRRVTHDTPSGSLASKERPPDIFYIILDGYGRQDMLQRVMHFDNSGFMDGLRKRGFYVADQSRSNYVQTEISLSSSLNFNTIPELAPHISPNSQDRKPFDALISDNAVARFLRDRGYRTIAVTSGFPPVRFPRADLWLTQASTISLFETTLLQMSPLVDTDSETESQFVWRRSALNGALKNISLLAEDSPRPRFVFVHILAPHPPFVFGSKGEAVRHHGPYGLWDGSDYITYVGPQSDYRNGYVGQVQYISSQVLQAVDKLLATKSKPIILIQGDHGSKMKLDQDRLEKTDVTECFENLSTYYVPDEVRAKLYPSITPVNSFRVILSTLFGAKLPNLPDRSWYSPFSYPFKYTDVTDKVTGKIMRQK